MKRRKFLKNVAALAAAPALPVKLAATPLPVSAEQYAKAVHWAGLWVHSTATTYKNVLGVDQSVANAVLERLQHDGILGALNKNGIARAVVPHYEIPQVAARIRKAMAKPAPSPLSDQTAPKRSLNLGKQAKEATSVIEKTKTEDQPSLTTAARPKHRPINFAEDALRGTVQANSADIA